MIALALLLATLAPDDGLTDQVAHCGIAREQISSRYEDYLQDEVATISTPAAVLKPEALSCLVQLDMSGRFIAFTDPAAQARYNTLYLAASRKAAAAEARQWLTEHGLLDKLPVYDPRRQTLAQFGVALEALCGFAPGTRLKLVAPKLFTFLFPADLDKSDVDYAAFQCVVSAAIAADPDEKSYQVGFIGNEAISAQ